MGLPEGTSPQWNQYPSLTFSNAPRSSLCLQHKSSKWKLRVPEGGQRHSEATLEVSSEHITWLSISVCALSYNKFAETWTKFLKAYSHWKRQTWFFTILNLTRKWCSGEKSSVVQNQGDISYNKTNSHKLRLPCLTQSIHTSVKVKWPYMTEDILHMHGDNNNLHVATLLLPLLPWLLKNYFSWEALESKEERRVLRNANYQEKLIFI